MLVFGGVVENNQKTHGMCNSDPPFPTQWFPTLPAFWTLVSPPQLYLITRRLTQMRRVTKWPHSQNVGEYPPSHGWKIIKIDFPVFPFFGIDGMILYLPTWTFKGVPMKP